jgi:pimeloyl-ACP methyl ester carboxylesterase
MGKSGDKSTPNEVAASNSKPAKAVPKKSLGKYSDETIGKVAGSLRLAGDTFEQAASRVHEFHRAVSDMPFKAVGVATVSASKPIEMIHNEVTDIVYDVVKDAGKGVFRGAAWLLEQATHSLGSVNTMNQAMDGELMEHALHAEAPLPVEIENKVNRGLSMFNSAVNGLIGDHLAATRNPISVKAGFYQKGKLIELTEDGLKKQFPQAQANLVVFVHGLCGNEDAWWFYYRKEDPMTLPYGLKLATAFDVTPLYLRYNTGLSFESNARNFKRMLKKVVKNWPVEVKSMTLIGHSMGGLVSRRAVEMLGAEEDQDLISVIRDVVSLGTPHEGSPLARIAGAGEDLLNKFELTKPFGKVLGVRSTGIRGLQDGLGALQTSDGHNVGFHLFGATMADSTGSWINETLGDGLVQMSSALADESGKAQRLAFAAKHHMNLLNDADIYVQLEAVIRQHLKPKLQTEGKDLPRLG